MKERVQKIVERIRNWALLKRVRESFAVRFLGGVAAALQKNPFPAQVFFILLFRLLLDVLYVTMLSPTYSYARMTVNLIPVQYLCSWAVVAAFAPLVARLNEGQSASSIIVTLINYLYFIPMTTYCGCKGTDPAFLVVAVLYWALLLLWQFRVPKVALAPVPARHMNVVFSLLTVGSVLLVLYISGRYTGFRFTLNFIDVYDIRFESMAYNIPRLLNYALTSMTVVLSVLLLYWMQKKRWVIFAGLVFIFLLYYSIGAHKAVFFFLFLVLACRLLYRPWMLRWAPGLLSLAVLAAMLEKKIIGTIYLMFLGIYRMMLLPVQLAEESMAYFQDNPLNLFRDGILGKLSFDSIYSTGIQYVMGEQSCYPESFANNGLLGDMFINLPVLLGLLLMPLVLVLCFRLLDLVSRRTAPKVLVAFCVYFANSFINVSWSTVLLTNGYLLACVLLYFFPKEEGLPS